MHMREKISLIKDTIIIFLNVIDLVIVLYYTIYPLSIPFNLLMFDLVVVLILIVEFMYRFMQSDNKKNIYEKKWNRTFRYGSPLY